MPKSPLIGRRIHIAGSIDNNPEVASKDDVLFAQQYVDTLVKELMKRGATFVVPVDADPKRDGDDMPICFDWVIWQAIKNSLASRQNDVPGPLAVAVQHHKTEDQIPDEYLDLWDELGSGSLVRIENAAHWNMACKRMEAQARYGDILITLGGGEGVLYLANLYHDAGRPVIPLNLPLVPDAVGSRKLHDYAITSSNSSRFFRMDGGHSAHDWVNRIRYRSRKSAADQVETLIELLENLEKPRAFAVRLLDPSDADFEAVQDFFDVVVQPVVEELGYSFAVIDGKQAYDYARIDQEIFEKLHRSALVVADITGGRPNCFLEMGYAFGRQLPTIVTARSGSKTPFDITTFSGLHWKDAGNAVDRRREFRDHFNTVRSRPPLVSSEGLIL